MPDSLLPLIERERAAYPSGVTDNQCAELLNRIAWQAGPQWGLLKKESGKHGTRYDGAKASVDHLVYLPTMRGVDVFGSAGSDDAGHGGPTTPQWNDNDASWEPFPPDRFIAAIPPQGAPVPVPVPTPTPTPTPVPPPDELLEAIQALRKVAIDLSFDVAALKDEVRAGNERLQRLEGLIAADRPIELSARLIGPIRGTLKGPAL